MGFSRHFSCSFNMGELRSLGLQRMDRKFKAGGLSESRWFPSSNCHYFLSTLPVLYNASHPLPFLVHSVRKVLAESLGFKDNARLQGSDIEMEEKTTPLCFLPANEM